MTNEQDFDSIELTDAIQAGFDYSDLENPMGAACKSAGWLTPDALRVNPDTSGLKLEFQEEEPQNIPLLRSSAGYHA